MSENVYTPEGSYIGTVENKAYLSDAEGLERAMNSGAVLEAMAVKCDENMRLWVDLGFCRGVIEREDAVWLPDGGTARDIAVITRVGKAVCFKIKRIIRENGKLRAVLSRAEAQKECYENYVSHLRPGDVCEAKITHLESFGAFCDIGCGLVALLTIDCISVSRICHPRDRFTVGQRLPVIIKSVEEETGRIFVSHKELLGTWEENAALFSVGQTVAGVVRSIESYGIFVELTPNLAGLAEYRDDITVGQTAAVYIKNIIPERMKLKLVLIDSYRGELEVRRAPILKLPENGHLDRWQYSPDESAKTVVSVFTER